MSRSLSYRRRLGYKGEKGPQVEGAQAFRNGLPPSSNPYGSPSGFGKARAWRKGYNNARTQTAK